MPQISNTQWLNPHFEVSFVSPPELRRLNVAGYLSNLTLIIHTTFNITSTFNIAADNNQ
jgi:hypothetical protein